MFWGHFRVLNESGETLYITPIGERDGQRDILLEGFSRFPYVPILRRADLRLEPGESVEIYCRWFDEPPWRLVAIAVRNQRDEYSQLAVDESTLNPMAALSERSHRIESFDALTKATPEVVDLAVEASRLNVAAWAMVAAGFVPIGLFVAWYRLGWESQRESK
jgi:hypothetical protein